MKRAGFWTGVGTLFGAVRELLSTPQLWRLAVVPVVTLLTLGTVGVALVTWLGVPSVVHAIVTGNVTDGNAAWYQRLGSAALATVVWLVGCALALLLSWIITPVVCSPALEAIVRRVEASLGIAEHPGLSFFESLSCGLRAQLTGLLVLLPLSLGLWLLDLVLPFLAPLLLPIKLLAVGVSLAWNLLDYPLTLRGVPAGQRLRIIRTNLGAVAGFGLVFTALFLVPLAAVALLPLGVIGATRLVWQMADPTEKNWLSPPKS